MKKRFLIDPQKIAGLFNQIVDTPLGKGRSFGKFQIKSAHEEGIVDAVVVRLNIDETTLPHRKASNCLTPNATKTGLWVFPTNELGGMALRDVLLFAVVILILWALGRFLGVPW